jgi:hypothetical protein
MAAELERGEMDVSVVDQMSCFFLTQQGRLSHSIAKGREYFFLCLKPK